MLSEIFSLPTYTYLMLETVMKEEEEYQIKFEYSA